MQRGSVAAAVIPIENSLAGSVTEHFDLLLARQVFIEQEFRLRIVHNLIALPGVKRSDCAGLTRIPWPSSSAATSSPEIRRFSRLPFYDTAGSVKHVIENRLRDAAGIAGAPGSEGVQRPDSRGRHRRRQTQLHPLLSDPQDAARSCLGPTRLRSLSASKTLPGALFKALAVFALRDISLTKIESRPMRGRPWEYVFYADFLRGDDEPARNALRHLGEVADLVKVLGIYPAA